MKKILFTLLIGAGAVCLSARGDVALWSPRDLATVDLATENPGGTSSAVYFRTGAGHAGSVFTLGADADWRGKVKWVGPQAADDEPIVFDFSDGDHTLRCNSVYWPNQAHVTFRGGSWIAPGDWRFPGYGTATGRTVIFDGSNWDIARNDGTYFWGANGADNVIAFTNGATMTGLSAAFVQANAKRNLLHVSTGARVDMYSADNDFGKSGVDYGFASNRLVITGAGTFYRGSNLSAGRWSSGNETLIADGAAAAAAQLIVGYGEYARSNTLTIADHASVTNTTGTLVGYSAGATHNRLVVRDSTYRTANTYSAEQIGVFGSFNEALFENVDFTTLFRISCGIRPGASNNVVTLRGAMKIANSSGSFKYQLFGSGQHNTQIFDNYSDNWPNARFYLALYENGASAPRASTNNCARIVNGSVLNVKEFECHVSCASNTVLVQDSEYHENQSLSIRGDSNRFILDDSTLYLTRHAGNFVLGSEEDDTKGFVETNNQLVIRGTHPKIRRANADYESVAKVYDGGKVVIEVPEAGYDAADLPLFDGTGVAFHDDSTLEIRVPAALQAAATGTLRYKLADVIESDADDADFLASVNAQLPAGCVAYRGDDGRSLYLQVEPAPDVPDAWMKANFPGAQPSEYEEILQRDSDGDGFANWQEFICGSDPNDGESALALDVSVIGGHANLTWTPTLAPAEAAKRTYTVWGRDFTTDEWTLITDSTEKIFLNYRLEVAYGSSTVLSAVAAPHQEDEVELPPLSDETVLRMAPMGMEPTIDGTISRDEEHGASVQYGAISDTTGLMALRLCVFHFGYTSNGVYFAARTSVPERPQTLTTNDTVSLELLLPWATATKKFTVRVGTGEVEKSGGGGEGLKSASRILDGTCDYGVLCAETELFIPYSALGVTCLEEQRKIGLQMYVNFSSKQEQARWHGCQQEEGEGGELAEMGTLIPDANVPTVSIVNWYALEQYRSSGNYRQFYRYNNRGNAKTVKLTSESVLHRGVARAKLDDNPEEDQEIVHETVSCLPESGMVAAGEEADKINIAWVIWSGSISILDSDISADGVTVYRRRVSWDLSVGSKWSSSLPMVRTAFFPCRDNLLRIEFHPMNHTLTSATVRVVGVKEDKTYWEKSFVSAKSHQAYYAIVNTNLTELVPDDYEVRMTAVGADGQPYSDTATFAITNFPWQTAELGMDRVIIPPFVPIKVASDTISFLQTGYKCGGVLWDEVYAQGENLMKGAVTLKLNGQEFTVTGTRFVEISDDRVIREVTAEIPLSTSTSSLHLTVTQTYDQDGFCWVKFAFDAGEGATVSSLQVVSPLKNELAKYFNVLNRLSDVRAGPAPNFTLPTGEGEVWNSSVDNTNAFVNTTYPACIQPYIWWGGVAKGFCWITDCVRDLSLDRTVPAERIIRADGAATLVCDLVNVPVTWTGTKTFEMGFQPSPAKPKEPLFHRFAERMYSYACPSNAEQMSTSWGAFQFSSLHNPINLYPGDDTSLRDWTYAQPASDYAAYTVRLNDYIERNRAALEANPSTSPADYAAGNGSAHRYMGVDCFMCYFDPLLITSFWPEWEMYKSEWYPVMWPEDHYVNEYMAQVCKSRIDKLMWDAQGALDGGAGGLYYDCFCSKGGEGLASENVYLKPGGYYIQKQLSNVLEWRNVMKRSAVLCLKKGRTFCGRPIVELHDTNLNVVPVTTFCLSCLSTERGSDGGDFQDRFCESYTLVNIVGAGAGKCSRFIVSTNEGDTERQERELKSLMGYMCAYGCFSIVDQGIIQRDWFWKAWNIPFDYGWGRTNVQHVCYWDDQPKPVRHGGADVRLTVAKKSDSALLLFGNLGEATDVSFNIAGLSFGTAELVDAETGAALAEPTVRLDRHGYRMVLVRNPVPEGTGENRLEGGRDLATYVPPNDGSLILCPTDDVPYTVSFDADFSDRTLRLVGSRPIRINIADGATLKVLTVLAEGENLPSFEVTGGKLELADEQGADFRCSHWGGTYTTNRVFRFDGTAVDGVSYFWGLYGRDNLIALTNGASITADFFNFTLAQNPSGRPGVTTNNTLFISNGSRVTAPAIEIDYGGATDVPQASQVIVTGEGSFFGSNRPNYNWLCVGQSTGGNTLVYRDGASGYCGNLVIGYGENASGNRAVFDGASYTNEQDLYLGYAASSRSNRVEVLNGASLVEGKYNPVHVGYRGAYNELFVSNAAVVCARLGIGDCPGADFNRVTIAGPESALKGDALSNQIFGFGRYNECVYDGCELGDNTSFRTYFINSKAAGSCTGTTNNTLRLVNGATLHSYDLIFDCGCASNLLHVGADCSLDIGHDLIVRGLENTLVLSNASVNVTASGDNLRLGSEGENTTDFAEYGNRLVLQGRSRLFNSNQYVGFRLYDHAVLEIDVPPEGYDSAAPVFDKVGFTADGNTRLVFRGIERAVKRLSVATDFILANNGNFALVNAPAGQTFSDWLAAAEGLPSGCFVALTNATVGGAAQTCLVLHVEPMDPIPDLGENPAPEEIDAALSDSADGRLRTCITDASTYNAYRAWAEEVWTADGKALAGHQAVWESVHAWLAFATASERLIETLPTNGAVRIVGFEPTAAAGRFDFTVGVDGLPIGSAAQAENLKKVFGLEGGEALRTMSADQIDLEFAEPDDGNVRFTAGPNEEHANDKTFFMRVKMTP